MAWTWTPVFLLEGSISINRCSRGKGPLVSCDQTGKSLWLCQTGQHELSQVCLRAALSRTLKQQHLSVCTNCRAARLQVLPVSLWGLYPFPLFSPRSQDWSLASCSETSCFSSFARPQTLQNLGSGIFFFNFYFFKWYSILYYFRHTA